MKDGGPAFPGYTVHDDGESVTVAKLDPGMSLRDYFAGQALVGILTRGMDIHKNPKQLAKHAYQNADAMLAAREATNAAT